MVARLAALGALLLTTACRAGQHPSPADAAAAPLTELEPPSVTTGKPDPAARAVAACVAQPVAYSTDSHSTVPFPPRDPDPEVLADAEDCDSQPAPNECRFAVGNEYLHAHQFARALPVFRHVARSAADSLLGQRAARAELLCLQWLGTYVDPPRPTCFEYARYAIGELEELYCVEYSVTRQAGPLCAQLLELRVGAQRLVAERLAELGDRRFDAAGNERAEALTVYRRAARLYRDIWQHDCADLMVDTILRQPPRYSRCDELLLNLHRVELAGRRPERARWACRAFFDVHNGLVWTPLAKLMARSCASVAR